MNSFLHHFQAVSFFGRPFDELLKCFDLSESDLRGQSVLECPSGPSSFVAEARRLGVAAVGVDPLFYRSPKALEQLAMADFRAMFYRIRQEPERFVARTYASIDEAETRRRAGLQIFLAHYASNFTAGHYRAAALPDLPFPDQSFDLVLCGHLLFLYQELLDFEFHSAALLELCRVARSEVRIHPVVDDSSSAYKRLPELLERAVAVGFEVRLLEVDHEFFRGAHRTLVLRRKPAVALGPMQSKP